MAEVGSAFVSLLPSFKGFGSKMEQGVGAEVDKSGKGLGKRLGVGIAAGAAGAVAAGAFLKGAIDSASDLAEAGSKVDVVFGKQAATIKETAKTAATSMGLTESAYLGATGSLGNLLVSLDLAPKKAAGMSQEMVALAGDLASFNNVSSEDALAALQSGLTGETEPLKAFGVNMNEATLKAEALKMGLIKTEKEALTPQAKALAAQALIMSQTGTAQGDFARTSAGLANQQRILAAQFGDLKTKLGGLLLPILTTFVTFLTATAMPALEGVGGSFSALGPIASQVGGYLTSVWDAFNGGGATMDALKLAVSTIGGAFTAAFGGGGGLGGAVTTLQSFAATVSAGVLPIATQLGAIFRDVVLPAVTTMAAAFITHLAPALKAMGDTFTGSILPAVTAVVTYFASNLAPIFTQVAGVITGSVIPVVGMLAQFFYGTLYPAVVAIAVNVGSKLKPVFDALFAVISGKVIPAVQKIAAKFTEWMPTITKVAGLVVKLVGFILGLAATILGKVLPVVIKFAGFLIGVVVSAVLGVIDVIVKIIGFLIDLGTGYVNVVKKVAEFVAGLKEKMGQAVTFVQGIPGKVVDALGDVGSLLKEKGSAIIQGFIDGVMAKIDAVRDAVGKVTDAFGKFFPGSPVRDGALRAFNGGKNGKALMDTFARGVLDGGKNVIDAVSTVARFAADAQDKADKQAEAKADAKEKRDEQRGKRQDRQEAKRDLKKELRENAADIRSGTGDAIKKFVLTGDNGAEGNAQELADFRKAVKDTGVKWTNAMTRQVKDMGTISGQYDTLALSLKANEDALKTLTDTSNAYNLSVAASFNNDLFGKGLAGFSTQLEADTNDTKTMSDLLLKLEGLGLDGALFKAVAESADIGTATELAALTSAEIEAFEDQYDARASAQAGLGAYAASEVYGQQLAQQQSLVTQQTQTLANLDNTLQDLEFAVEAGARAGIAEATQRANQRSRTQAKRDRNNR